MNILIVDDKAENLYLLASLLKGYGHKIQIAANGAQAFELLQAGKVELIISDILMPGMDGRQLTETLRKGIHFLQKLFNETDLAIHVQQALVGDLPSSWRGKRDDPGCVVGEKIEKWPLVCWRTKGT